MNRWNSQQYLEVLVKYRSGERDQPLLSTPKRPDEKEENWESFVTPVPTNPIEFEPWIGRTATVGPTTLPTPPTAGRAPSTAAEETSESEKEPLPTTPTRASSSTDESKYDTPAGKKGPSDPPPTGKKYASDPIYAQFMKLLMNKYGKFFDYLVKLFKDMRCQLTESYQADQPISNELREKGKFLIPTEGGITSDNPETGGNEILETIKDYNPDPKHYVAIVTFDTINGEKVTKDINIKEIDTEQEDIKKYLEAYVEGKHWVRIIKSEDSVQIPWSPPSIDVSINNWSNTEKCVDIGIQTDPDDNQKFALLHEFMYEHTHCCTNIQGAKYLMDVLKSFLFVCGAKYIRLTDGTFDVLNRGDEKFISTLPLSKKIQSLLIKGGTVYTNYGFKPCRKGIIEWENFIDCTIDTSIGTIHKKTQMFSEITWKNDICYFEFRFEDSPHERKLYKKMNFDYTFNLLFKPMLQNIAAEPALWFGYFETIVTNENGKRITTVKDILQKSIADFKAKHTD